MMNVLSSSERLGERRSNARRLGAISKVFARTWHQLNALKRVHRRYPDWESNLKARTEIEAIMQRWCDEIFSFVKLKIHKSGAEVHSGPCLFVANHLGYLDIPVMMSLTGAAFLSKKEIRSWPIFGPAAEAVGTLFVDRASASSRRQVARSVGEAIRSGRRLVLFPEGTSSSLGKAWKRGAFAMAEQYEFPIQPIRLLYRPLRKSAYFDKDTFVPHLWRLLGENQIDVYAELHEPIWVKNSQEELKRVESWVKNSFRKKLLEVAEPAALLELAQTEAQDEASVGGQNDDISGEQDT
jgi:1-acyl-sn-glycerol-3-phosphate acyltransferase